MPARELGVTPPAVAHRIRMLESHLGAELFERGRRSVRLNRRGRAYYEEVRRILLDIHETTARHVSVFTIIDGAVITLFDGPRPRSGRAWAGCREAVDASSRYAAPSLLLRPAFDRGRSRVRAGPAPVPGSTHPSKCPWTRMHGSASGCCSACGFDADRHAMLLQSFASEGSTSYAKQQPAERRDRLAALTLVTRRRNAHTGSMSTEALMC